jgi:hypothetical protein
MVGWWSTSIKGEPKIESRTVNIDDKVKAFTLDQLRESVDNGGAFFTNYGLVNAWKQGDYSKMDYIWGKIGKKSGITNYMVDVSLEEGDEKMAKYLIAHYDARPSLYAKQMAEINGHIKLAKLIESLYPLRNSTSIFNVHWSAKAGWNQCIPHQYQFQI